MKNKGKYIPSGKNERIVLWSKDDKSIKVRTVGRNINFADGKFHSIVFGYNGKSIVHFCDNGKNIKTVEVSDET